MQYTKCAGATCWVLRQKRSGVVPYPRDRIFASRAAARRSVVNDGRSADSGRFLYMPDAGSTVFFWNK